MTIPPEAFSGLSRGRITSAFHTLAPSMFSPSVLPFTVFAERSSRSRNWYSIARRPPA
jgi:hypothetical protein